MPWYTQDCPVCGILDDVSRPVSEYKVCAECGGPCAVLLAPTLTIGIVFSNAETNNQLGTHWETNKQKRDWLAKHPGVVEMTKGDINERKFHDGIRNEANGTAKKKGYRDLEHMKVETKKAKKAQAST